MSDQIRPGSDMKNGDRCTVVVGRHSGKSGVVEDRNISKAGHVTVSVRQDDGVRFKTLAKSVVVQGGAAI